MDNGDEITGYNVLFESHDLEYYPSPACDASLTTLPNGDLQCTVPFTELRNAPFNLQFLATVKAKFNAYNLIGQGEYSQPNAEGSFIEVEPQAVRGITLDPALSDTTSVHITWTHLFLTVETGASPVLNYLIKTDQGTGVWADFD